MYYILYGVINVRIIIQEDSLDYKAVDILYYKIHIIQYNESDKTV